MSYSGARKKATVGNRNVNHHSSETGAKSKKYFAQNSGGDGWGNASRRPLRSNNDDDWGATNRRPSNYTTDDIWSDLPSQPAVPENEKRGSKKNQKFQTDHGKKPVPLVGPNFSWNDQEYPALESRSPVENVWEKRKEKLEGRKAMEPTNLTEEELMIQKAIELSKREAEEEEERKRLIEEEYELQTVILATNPQLFSDFLTPDELVEANKSLKPETKEYQSNYLTNSCEEKESVWDYPKPVESPEKQSKKAGKKKKSSTPTHMEEEINTENPWSDSQKFDHDIQNESVVLAQTEYQDNWSQNSVKHFNDKAEENESQFIDEGSDFPSTEQASTVSPEVDDESKTCKVSQPKISKVIDMFGGWGSKNTQNSSIKSSYKQRFESYDNHSSVNFVSDNEEIFQDNWKETKEMSKLNKNLQFTKYSSKHEEVENFSKSEKSQLAVNEEYLENGNELKHSLYSHVESNIATSASFCNAATNSSDISASYLSKKFVPNDDIMNNIVEDYANLAVKCTDSSTKDKITVQRKATDIFGTVATLFNEDNLEPDRMDLPHSNINESQNSSMLASNQTAEREIMYTLNNTALAEFSTKTPNENVTGSGNDSKIGFPTHSERNEINDNLFLPHNNGSVQDIHNDHESNPTDPTIAPPIQHEMNFPCQPNLINPNLMMSMAPLMVQQQQMMMLNNPFFLQQLHQMQMYYRAMSMPFAMPFPPMQPQSLNPLLNNLMGSCFNGEHNNNMKPVPELNVESNSSVPPLCHKFENRDQRSMSPKSCNAPSVEFENSWISDLLCEGAAHMDSYIPPPTMPVTNPPKQPLNAENKVGRVITQDNLPNVENKVGMNIAQDISQYMHRKETIPHYSDCDTKSLKQESSVLKNGRTNVNANIENVISDGAPKSSMSDAVEASGWGDIDDMPKKSYNSWNDDMDGWVDEKETTSKSMIRSSIYASRKQATTRQPIRQPRQNSQWS